MILTTIQVTLLVLAFLSRAFFAGSETALVSVNPVHLEHLARSGNARARLVQRLHEDRQRMISIVLVGTNITGILATVLATSLTQHLGLFGDAGIVISTIAMIVLVLVFGEIIPKSYAANRTTQTALAVAPWIIRSGWVLGPIGDLFTTMPKHLLRGRRSTARHEMTEDSIRTMLAIGEEEGAVEEDEREMIYGMFDTGETPVREVMTPRVDMSYAEVSDSLDEILDLFETEGFSRLPIYEETIDNIIGVLYAKDLLPYFLGGPQPEIRSLLRPTLFVPETKRVDELLDQMREARVHLAIVLDEYGGTAGLVTIEDLLEEIFGEIHDEYDIDEEAPIISRGENSLTVDARLTVDEVNEELGLLLPDDEVDTIGGLLYSLVGRVPYRGEKVVLPDQQAELTAERVIGRRIVRVRVTRLNPVAPDD